MRRLIHFLKGYEKESVIGPLFKMLEAFFELIVPIIMANIIDIGIKNSDKNYIMKMCLIMVILGLLGFICSITAQYFAAKASMGFGAALRRSLFLHINELSYADMDELTTPALITRLTSDANQVQSGVNMVLRLFLRSPFIVVGAVIASFLISAKITIIFLITVPLISLAVFLITAKTIPMYKQVQSKLDRISLLVRENLVGARVIRAFSKQKEEKEQFDIANENLMVEQLSTNRISALLNPLTYIIVNLAIIAIIWVGGFEVDAGVNTQGEIVALVNYMSQILLALIALANLIVIYTKASASALRISEVFDKKTSVEERITAAEFAVSESDKSSDIAKIEFRNVSFAYKNSQTEFIKGLNLKINRGATIGMIGGTGSGKTTIIQLIPRFYDVLEGSVLIDGIDVKDYPLEILRKKIGLVPQKAILFEGTIRDNVKWGKKDATDEEIYEALRRAQALEFVEKKEEGLDTYVSQGGANLSGGQRQRLCIARAIIRKPEILILDDSASALDYATEAKLRKEIAKLNENMTIIIISQRTVSIEHADEILVLDDGSFVASGKHEELLSDCDIYKEIWQSQNQVSGVAQHG